MTKPNPSLLAEKPWHHLTGEEVLTILDVNINTGLSEAEAERRRIHHGLNELIGQASTQPWRRFLMEFNQPLIYILLLAGCIALVLQDWVDAGVILGVTFLNATIGFIQESKAEEAIAALAKSVKTEATVLRDRQKIRLDSKHLVPGDVVFLSAGDKVPADLRLIACRNLRVSEAALTGESLPVSKALQVLPIETVLADRLNMVYAGSLVTAGRAQGLVIAIGNRTETGRISQLMAQQSRLETPLTRKIERFSKTLLIVIMGLAVCMFVVVLSRAGTWTDGFKAAVALAVSAIPEGLPAVVTVTLAIGVSRMAQRNAIIRKLPAVETLGSTTVICSDKTGTLTENQMTVQAIYAGGSTFVVTGSGYAPQGDILYAQAPVALTPHPALDRCLLCGLLCNDAHLRNHGSHYSITGDPTEGALIVAAEKRKPVLAETVRRSSRLDTLAFESQFQYMATLHQLGDTPPARFIFVKGSMEAILHRCQQSLDTRGHTVSLQVEAIEAASHALASQGLRVLAFAEKPVHQDQTRLDHRDIDTGLIFLGLQGMIDPPRQEAIRAITACQSAGIEVKMITGDHALTAMAIAQRIGLVSVEGASALTGHQLAKLSDCDLIHQVKTTSVFARVAPEQKLRLVEALQYTGAIVAMTGDGVNDAPALKQADIGIAMGITGTEVAKEAADMILTDDNFASIEAAVEEGRTVYANLLKTIAFILPVNGGEALTILVGVLAASTLPILPVQILWVNMVSSVALSATLAFEPKALTIMNRPPRPPHEPLLTGQLLLRIMTISVVNLLAVFGIFEWALQTYANLSVARTMAVHTLVAAETIYLLCLSHLVPSLWSHLRGEDPPITLIPAVGVACVLLLQILFSQVEAINPLFETYPLGWPQALICLLASLPVAIPALILKKVAPLT